MQRSAPGPVDNIELYAISKRTDSVRYRGSEGRARVVGE